MSDQHQSSNPNVENPNNLQQQSSNVVYIRQSPAQTGGGGMIRPTGTPTAIGRVTMTTTTTNRGGVLSPTSMATISQGNVVASPGFVLRGNQLVRLPTQSPSSATVAAGGSKSPLKVHLVSATGLVKQQPLGPGTPAGGIRPQIGGRTVGGVQVLTPSAQNSQQVLVVNSAGVTKSVQGTPTIRPDGQVVYLGGTSVGASATVGESGIQQATPVTGGSLKKVRTSGTPGSRKPCNCTKSQCLKLYCECFANGEFCRNCNCNNCHNNLAYENERSKSIKMCLERNPYAFQPKIGLKGRAEVTERLHSKGCNCKKSSCLKNYCECYEAKVPCTHRCKCVGCRNTEGDRVHKYRGAGGLQSLANAASLLSAGHHASDFGRSDSPSTDASYDKPDPKRMPWYYMTDDVVEATALCLLAKAEQMETDGGFEEVDCQREILKEFGRCLQQIISSAAD